MIPSAEQKNSKTVNYTNGSQKGVLVKFDFGMKDLPIGDSFFSLDVHGSAFSAGPFSSVMVFDATHEKFQMGKQANIVGNLPACSVGEVDGKIAVWIPHIRTYSIFSIETIYMSNQTGLNLHTSEELKEKPVMDYEHIFTINT